MGNQPHKHHTVPQFYLAGFTKSDSKDGDLFVLDQTQQKSWKSTPRNSAHSRDFHAIEAGLGKDPMIIEKTLAEFETQWGSAVRQVIQRQAIPDDDSFGDLMMFVASMAVRVVRFREILADFVDRVSKSEIVASFSTEEGRAAFRKVIEEQVQDLSDEAFEELVAYGLSGQFDVDFEQTWHVQQMVLATANLAPLLSLRKWTLWIADDGVPDLICSDSPVAPTWASQVNGPYSPAFGTPNTIVSIPLNRRIALVSMLDVQLPERRLDRAAVAAINSATGKYANQLYAPDPDFVWAMKDHRVGNAEDLLMSLRGEQKP